MRKGFVQFAIIGIILIFAVVALIPGLGQSVWSAISGTPQACWDAPFQENCYCNDDQEKLVTTQYGIPKYVCELVDKFIDPSDTGWEAQSIAFADQVLTDEYPACDMASCSQGNWFVTYGWHNTNKRVIVTECWSLDQRFSGVTFDVEDGDLVSAHCSSFQDLPTGTPTFIIAYAHGTNPAEFNYNANCFEGTGSAISSHTYTLPDAELDAVDWQFQNAGTVFSIHPAGTCELINMTPRSVTIYCEAICSGYGGYGSNFGITHSLPPNTCGNGILDAGEQCDDGNVNDGDGCSSTCTY